MDTQQLEHLKEAAIHNLEKDGHLIPLAILEDRQGKLNMMVFAYETKEEKDAFFGMLGMELKTGKYKSFTHISEAYMVKRPGTSIDDVDTDIKVSEEPDRQEVIIITVKNEDGTGIMQMIPFIKDKDRITILHEEINTQQTSSSNKMGGNLWELWK